MAASQIFPSETQANTDVFVKLSMSNAPFSLMFDTGHVTGGSPTYTVMCCNFDGHETDFRPLSEANLNISDYFTANDFKFIYLGLKYKSNSATGTIQAYLNIIK